MIQNLKVVKRLGLAMTAAMPLWFVVMPVASGQGRSIHEYPGGVSRYRATFWLIVCHVSITRQILMLCS